MKREKESEDWSAANQRGLMAELSRLRRVLGEPNEPEALLPRIRHRRRWTPSVPVFGLSGFERRIVLLCAGMELDGGFAAQCAAPLGGNPGRRLALRWPLFPRALGRIANRAPLRHWRLIETIGNGPLVAESPADRRADFVFSPALRRRMNDSLV
jgi:hypothetical protein